MRRLRHRLGLNGFEGFSSDGFSGGLALFWHESICVEVQAMNNRYIDANVRESPSAPQWRLTCVYGEPRVEDRHLMWDALRNLKNVSNLPWLVFGDLMKRFGRRNTCLIHQGLLIRWRLSVRFCLIAI
jgi:hypothetical protein